ncbi:MAG: hypothetical protein GXO19_06865 [Epsilonproteobacteria bacterium]|nr:hypothetical protein [Campylobacterota bacterium]NPA57437.1 hypothetical protein [Campylobacterota bacterium]
MFKSRDIFHRIAFLLLLTLPGWANELFSLNITCKECHPTIYQEYRESMHAKATIFADEIHKKVWELLPFSQRGEYSCGYCHTPAANNLEELVKANGIGPDPYNPTQNDAIGCALCHRISDVKEGKIHNFNVISKKQRVYFARKKPLVESPFHKVDITNPLYQKGNNCTGCHGHYSNDHGIQIFTSTPNLSKINCVECHMPQMEGSSNTLIDTKTHAYHGGFGKIVKQNISKYLNLQIRTTQEGFEIDVVSRVPHIVLTTPLKSLYLSVDVVRKNQIVFHRPEFFVRALSDEKGQIAIPWFAREVLIDTMLEPGEKRTFAYKFKLQKGDRVTAILSKVLLGYEVDKGIDGSLSIKKIKIVNKPEPLLSRVFLIK